jgi:hypothetical protein
MLAQTALVLVACTERGVRPDGVVMTPPTLNDDLCFAQCVEDLTNEQLVAQTTSLTPIWRIASAML